MLSVVSLLFISTGVFAISRKFSVPYSILLVLSGLVLIPISKIPAFNFFHSFTLTPGLLFFVFLPTLIFESAYNMKIQKVLESARSITLLSIVSLLLSVFFIAWVLSFLSALIGLAIPFAVTLLFAALISATDPVAVLALFKEYGAPKRLALIFEGESLFNDGTALALFLVVLEVLAASQGSTDGVLFGYADILSGTFLFITMVLGGIVFGLLMGALFSKLIQQVRDNEVIEITLTMVVAHFTFILSEVISHSVVILGYHLQFSSIIATVVAAMMVGNYGRYKISPSVVEYMEHFWGYFAFVANSIIFILIGLLFDSLPISLLEILPITLLTVAVVVVARAVSIYPIVGLLNLWNKEEHIPMTWQHLLAWGSLRGALAVTMVLLIPDSFTISGWDYPYTVKEFITALTIACIYFTLFVKGLTIGPIIRYFKLNALNAVESGEYHEAKALLYAKLIIEIERFHRKRYITVSVYEKLKSKYVQLYIIACKDGEKMFTLTQDVNERVLVIYALAMAKHSLKSLFTFNEVSETVYKKILVNLATQLDRAEESKDVAVISLVDFKRDWLDALQDVWEKVFRKDPNRAVKTLYMFYRARIIIMHKAIEELESLAESNLEIFKNKDLFHKIIGQLQAISVNERTKADELSKKSPDLIELFGYEFAEAGIQKAKRGIINMLSEREVLSPKVYAILKEEL